MSRTIHPWLLVGLLWVVALLNYLDRQVIFSLFPLLEKDLRATSVELGLTSTVFLWVYGILSPFAGYLADRIGRVRVIVASLIVWSAVTWLTGLVRNVPELLAARALMGISEAFYLPAALALIADVHGERTKSLATGLHQSGLYTGIVIGGAWGGWMGDHQGWRPVFTQLGIAGLVYVGVLFLFLRRAESRRQSQQAEGNPFAVAMSELLANRAFLGLVAVFGLWSFAGWIVLTWLPLYLFERFQMTLTNAGFSATFYVQAAAYAGVLLGGIFADRWSAIHPRARVVTQVAGLAIGAPFLAVVGFTHSVPLLIVALLAYGLGRGLFDANIMPVLSQVVRPGLRATGYGVFNFAGCIVGGGAAAGGGWLKSNIGLASAFELSSALLLAAAILLYWLPSRLKTRE